MLRCFIQHAALAWIAFFAGVGLVNLITPPDTLHPCWRDRSPPCFRARSARRLDPCKRSKGLWSEAIGGQAPDGVTCGRSYSGHRVRSTVRHLPLMLPRMSLDGGGSS